MSIGERWKMTVAYLGVVAVTLATQLVIAWLT